MDAPVRVVRLSTEQLVVAPIRLALGVVLAVVAGGVEGTGGMIAVVFAAGTFASAFGVIQDPRRRMLRQHALRELPAALPAGAVVESLPRLAWTAVFPSTVGVTALAAIALGVGRPVLAAFLAGVVAGLGVAALVRGGTLLAEERRRGCALLADRRAHLVYERPL